MSPDSSTTSEPCIQAFERPKCPLCGSQGEPLYRGLMDGLFGAPGRWNLSICRSRSCRLVWLDPMPTQEDLWIAYRRYYTHDAPPQNASRSFVRKIYRRLRDVYIQDRFGYAGEKANGFLRLLARAFLLTPYIRQDIIGEVRQLTFVPRGRLLDIGCGSGDWLHLMRARGWSVEGLDLDETAVANAKDRGLPVHCGTVHDRKFPEAHFDAVTLNQVIEHVPDPIAVLSECHRILKPGGHLILYTPNSSSLGHRVFGRHWRGLEPPRHLHLFGPHSMASAFSSAGFNKLQMRTINSTYVWLESVRTRLADRTRPYASALAARTLAHLEQFYLFFDPVAGECLVVDAVKD